MGRIKSHAPISFPSRLKQAQRLAPKRTSYKHTCLPKYRNCNDF
jgi:hypothetical protein